MSGIRVIDATRPLPAKPAHCESVEGCQHEAQKMYGRRWFCNFHFYRLYRDIEMNNEGGEA